MIPADEEQSNKVLKGTVLSVGPGYRNAEGKTFPMQYKVGDRVLLRAEDGGTKVVYKDKEYLIFRESVVNTLILLIMHLNKIQI